jgi:hypothetical protein
VFQAQHAPRGHNKIIISALRTQNFQDDKPEEKEEQPLPSLFDNGTLQPSEVGTDNKVEPEITPPVKRVTHSKSRVAAFVVSEVCELQPDDDSEPEGSLPGSDAAKAPAARTKKACSKGTSTTADQSSGRTSTSAAVVAGNPRFIWDVSEDHSPLATVPRLTPKSVGSLNLLRGGIKSN